MKTISEAAIDLQNKFQSYAWFNFVGLHHNRSLIVYVRTNQELVAMNVVPLTFEGYKVEIREIGETSD
jgi:hypothetical protein